MMKSAFKIETAFSKAPKFGVAQLVEKIEKEIEHNVMELVEYEGSATWDEDDESSGDYDIYSSSDKELMHLFY